MCDGVWFECSVCCIVVVYCELVCVWCVGDDFLCEVEIGLFEFCGFVFVDDCVFCVVDLYVVVYVVG